MTYYAAGSFYPSIVSNQDVGFLVPGIRNTSFWIRNSAGQSFGSKGTAEEPDALSFFYLGGFRNNYVDSIIRLLVKINFVKLKPSSIPTPICSLHKNFITRMARLVVEKYWLHTPF